MVRKRGLGTDSLSRVEAPSSAVTATRTARPKMGRKPKYGDGPPVNMSLYLHPGLADELKRFTFYLASERGKPMSYSETLAEALEAHHPFVEWRKRKASSKA